SDVCSSDLETFTTLHIRNCFLAAFHFRSTSCLIGSLEIASARPSNNQDHNIILFCRSNRRRNIGLPHITYVSSLYIFNLCSYTQLLLITCQYYHYSPL